APGKALVVRLLSECAVHARRTDLQNVARTRHQFLDIEDDAQLLADAFAIGVGNFRIGVRLAVFLRRGGRNPVDIHPKEALFADLPLDVNDFQPLRTSNPLGSVANFFQLQAETPRPMPVDRPRKPADTKKRACAHSIVRPVTSEIKVYARDTAKARQGEK